jgi:hypothetical protein
VDIILLDWTRMGKTYCVAGAVPEDGGVRVVRPLLGRPRGLPLRNVGWSPWLLDGHSRWEVFELVGPHEAAPEPPHLEDVWVHSLRPRRGLAPAAQRRAVLQGLAAAAGADLFGAPLVTTRAAAYLPPGQGRRSLGTLVVPAGAIRFSALRREGAPELDVRAALGVAPLGDRWLPVKDHHLLLRAERAASSPEGLARGLTAAVQAMGEQVAVRLGLSRAFQVRPQEGRGLCWVMADGFFSLADPQP